MSLITMKDCKFFVNEDARTVVCVIENTGDMFKKYAYHNLPLDVACDVKNYGMFSKLSNACVMPARFVGKAVCSVNDEWDEDIGRLVAYKRAKQKVYKSFFRHANSYMKTMDEYLDRTEMLLNKTGEKASDELAQLEMRLAQFFGDEEV